MLLLLCHLPKNRIATTVVPQQVVLSAITMIIIFLLPAISTTSTSSITATTTTATATDTTTLTATVPLPLFHYHFDSNSATATCSRTSYDCYFNSFCCPQPLPKAQAQCRITTKYQTYCLQGFATCPRRLLPPQTRTTASSMVTTAIIYHHDNHILATS